MTHKTTLHFVDSSARHRAELARIGYELGHHCEVYADVSDLVSLPPRKGIIVVRDDQAAGGVSAILDRLGREGIWLPLVAFDHDPNPGRIVRAVKAGALDYLTLPISLERLERCLARIEEEAAHFIAARRKMIEARDRISSLSNREREVLDWLSEGSSNKVIARELQISPRTVEIHRANMMTKLGASHAAEAVRLKLEADFEGRRLAS